MSSGGPWRACDKPRQKFWTVKRCSRATCAAPLESFEGGDASSAFLVTRCMLRNREGSGMRGLLPQLGRHSIPFRLSRGLRRAGAGSRPALRGVFERVAAQGRFEGGAREGFG